MRELSFYHKGDDELQIDIDKVVLNEIMEALLKNAVENTPDGGVVSVLFERKNGGAEIHVADTGIGITEENQRYLFSGFLFARESDFYSSGKPFMFGAGGKGLDLLRIRLYGRRYGFHISVKSRRCPYLPGDRDQCPGSIKLCHHCSLPEDCLESGGSSFSLFFPDVSQGK
jgi:signal transduction histidine kinase